jgi:two-component system phosphate regulon sensor histidine kinase PhoR
METGRSAINRTNINVCKTINEIVGHNKKAAEEKKITIGIEMPADEIIIEADEERLTQALDAIMNNAVKFTGEGGRIKVLLNNLFREVEIVISDTGIGIPAKDLPFLFQKFYRVNRLDYDISSPGMGLVFVKQIVDLHKGLIDIQSEPNKGTSVIIKLLKNIRE